MADSSSGPAARSWAYQISVSAVCATTSAVLHDMSGACEDQSASACASRNPVLS
ncbi:hypothetical protein [Prauserella cavernicola]|uniref:Uncharacterized protein n=1 Tax=Prauserella cavernicola TaxID=2800127 RepID=A0A934QUN9_9PSEU|nr:hypothetical protein [Prauserella cavernicola]MBK1786815.1 hypothetical protein [Prauserella cavernicola]